MVQRMWVGSAPIAKAPMQLPKQAPVGQEPDQQHPMTPEDMSAMGQGAAAQENSVGVLMHAHAGHTEQHPVALRHRKGSADPLHGEEDKLVDEYKDLYEKAGQGMCTGIELMRLRQIRGALKELQGKRVQEAQAIAASLEGMMGKGMGGTGGQRPAAMKPTAAGAPTMGQYRQKPLRAQPPAAAANIQPKMKPTMPGAGGGNVAKHPGHDDQSVHGGKEVGGGPQDVAGGENPKARDMAAKVAQMYQKGHFRQPGALKQVVEEASREFGLDPKQMLAMVTGFDQKGGVPLGENEGGERGARLRERRPGFQVSVPPNEKRQGNFDPALGDPEEGMDAYRRAKHEERFGPVGQPRPRSGPGVQGDDHDAHGMRRNRANDVPSESFGMRQPIRRVRQDPEGGQMERAMKSLQKSLAKAEAEWGEYQKISPAPEKLKERHRTEEPLLDENVAYGDDKVDSEGGVIPTGGKPVERTDSLWETPVDDEDIEHIELPGRVLDAPKLVKSAAALWTGYRGPIQQKAVEG